MYTTTISTKFQVVIPREIRKQFDLKAGQKVAFIPYKKTLHVIIVPPIEKARGILGNLEVNNYREEQDEDR